MEQHFTLIETLEALALGSLIIFPMDNYWAVGCDATNLPAVNKCLDLVGPAVAEQGMFLVDSKEMLEYYVGKIHPRLETLLAHHTRPITLLYKDVAGLPQALNRAQMGTPIKLTNDNYCKALIGSYGKAILALPASLHASVELPGHFGAVSSDILRYAQHVVKHRQLEKGEPVADTLAYWSDSNEIEVLER